MKICGNCGKEIVDAAKFCPICGAVQTSENSFDESHNHTSRPNNTGVDSGLRLSIPKVPTWQNNKTLIVAAAILLAYLYLTDFSLIVKLTGDVDSYMKKGNVCMESWDYDNAVKEFNKALIVDDNYARAYARRGEAYVAMRQYEYAKRDLDTALALDSKCVEAYRGKKALQYRDDEEMNDDKREKIRECDEKMKEYCNIKLHESPNDASLYLIRAQITPWADGTKTEIMSDCSKAIDLAPDIAQAYAVRAQMLAREKKNHERAMEDTQKALSINPACAKAYEVIGSIYNNQDEIDKCIETYTRATENVKAPSAFYAKLARNYVQKRDIAKADENYSRAISLAPHDSSLYTARARFYMNNGEYEKAIDDYKHIQRMYPNKKYIESSIEKVNKTRERNYVFDKIRAGDLTDKFEGLWVSDSVSFVSHKTKSTPDRWSSKSLEGMPYDFFSSDYAIEYIMVAKKDDHYILVFCTDHFEGIKSNGEDYQKQIEKKLNHENGGWWKSSIKQITANSDGNMLSVNSADMGIKKWNGIDETMAVSLALTYDENNQVLNFTSLEERRGKQVLQQGTTNFQYQFNKVHKYKNYSGKEYVALKDNIWKKGIEKLKNGKTLNE